MSTARPQTTRPDWIRCVSDNRTEPAPGKRHLIAHYLTRDGQIHSALWLEPDKIWQIGQTFVLATVAYNCGYRWLRAVADGG